ncbi:MAG: hypothetical protein AAFY20_23395 [Cyanobacteria bacterium J06639_14]
MSKSKDIEQIKGDLRSLSVSQCDGALNDVLLDTLELIEQNFEQDRLTLSEVKDIQGRQGLDGRNRSLILLSLVGLLGLALLREQISADAFLNAVIAIAGAVTAFGAVAAKRSS